MKAYATLPSSAEQASEQSRALEYVIPLNKTSLLTFVTHTKEEKSKKKSSRHTSKTASATYQVDVPYSMSDQMKSDLRARLRRHSSSPDTRLNGNVNPYSINPLAHPPLPAPTHSPSAPSSSLSSPQFTRLQRATTISEYMMQSFPSLFTGRDAVNWMMREAGIGDIAEAVSIGNVLITCQMIMPSERYSLCGFVNDETTYKFASNEMATRKTTLSHLTAEVQTFDTLSSSPTFPVTSLANKSATNCSVPSIPMPTISMPSTSTNGTGTSTLQHIDDAKE